MADQSDTEEVTLSVDLPPDVVDQLDACCEQHSVSRETLLVALLRAVVEGRIPQNVLAPQPNLEGEDAHGLDG